MFHFLAQAAPTSNPSQWATDVGYLMDKAGVLLLACSTLAMNFLNAKRQASLEVRQVQTEQVATEAHATSTANQQSIGRVAQTARAALAQSTPTGEPNEPPKPPSTRINVPTAGGAVRT